jgi:FtsP/CotA-like multicopper oxidase with cupredoxin domain
VTSKQRLTFLGVAAVIAVIAVVIILVAGGSGSSDTAGGVAADQPPGPILTQGKTPELTATQGDTIYLRVHANSDEIVHIHGYNIEKDVPAGKTISISFPAKINGIFEIEFHHSGATIAHLKVEPK